MASAEGSIGRAAQPLSGRRKRQGVRLAAVLPLGLTVLVAVVVVYPLGMVVFGSFWSAAPGQAGTMTFENWTSVLSDPATFEILLASLASASKVRGMAMARPARV